MLEDTKLESRKKSTGKDQGQIVRYSNLNKRFANKNDSVQKVEVFLSSHENNDFINRNALSFRFIFIIFSYLYIRSNTI